MKNITHQENQGIARIILAKPETHNAFDEQTIAELSSVFRDIATNDQVRVVILESTGANFCAGADLAWMKKMKDFSDEQNLADAKALAQMLQQLNVLPQPTIAKIQGGVYGGGVGLIACCDIAVAAKNASFCLSEVRLGLSPATISPYVVHAMGARQARRYFLTGEQIDANQALHLSLIHQICESKDLESKTLVMANNLLKAGPNALKIAKKLIFMASPLLTDEQMEATATIIAQQRSSLEAQEGLQAFFAKRPPIWRQESHEK